MPVPTVVQAPNAVLVTGLSSANLTMGAACGAGNSLIHGVVQSGSTARSWTVADTVNAGNATSELLFQANQCMQVHSRHSIAAGIRTTRAHYVPVLNSRLKRLSEAIDGRLGWGAPTAAPSLETMTPIGMPS